MRCRTPSQEGPDDITSSPKSNAASQVKRERSSLLHRTVPKDGHPQKMDGSPALLLLLALRLCCLGMQVQGYRMTVKFRDSSIRHPRLGQRLELECQTAKEDSGVFWVRMDRARTLHFIVYISSLGRITFEGNQKTSTRFEVAKDRSFYWLVVKSFELQDEGNYFCLMYSNQVLYFSPSKPAFLPVTTTPAPTTQGSATKEEPSPTTPDPDTSKKKEPDFFCDIFIWVPLAGACALLLLALAVTVMLCQRTRRRRCRCKRPVNGKPNVKPSVPRRHV
ncbi:T-cell surface glycoprotein CD8 alpha chain-like [Patagioenas fasciata monilis]|uniref:T-cell surface glycoprotein CD8 alpha chain-like n=1 Tax=Patagioenas fasciata monilis TaxID=372326 RepID=A0A1V4JEX9_PATFA|nr:T-cell surface glycoprotein CD8 alpha chain-like [Patagioenas fasciata monilis]